MGTHDDANSPFWTMISLRREILYVEAHAIITVG